MCQIRSISPRSTTCNGVEPSKAGCGDFSQRPTCAGSMTRASSFHVGSRNWGTISTTATTAAFSRTASRFLRRAIDVRRQWSEGPREESRVLLRTDKRHDRHGPSVTAGCDQKWRSGWRMERSPAGCTVWAPGGGTPADAGRIHGRAAARPLGKVRAAARTHLPCQGPPWVGSGRRPTRTHLSGTSLILPQLTATSDHTLRRQRAR